MQEGEREMRIKEFYEIYQIDEDGIEEWAGCEEFETREEAEYQVEQMQEMDKLNGEHYEYEIYLMHAGR